MANTRSSGPGVHLHRLSPIWGVGILFALGFGTLTLHVLRIVWLGGARESVVLGTTIPIGLSLSLVTVGIWLLHQRYQFQYVWRISSWCLGGVIGMLLAGGVLAQLQSMFSLPQEFFFLVNAISGGAVIGLLLGVYDVERERATQTVRAERERTEEMNQRLRMLNRVLRHDIRNSIGVIRGNAEQLADELDGNDRARLIHEKSNQIVEKSEQAQAIADLIDREETGRTRIDLADIVRSKCAPIAENRKGVELETDLPDELHVTANQLIDSAVENVIENAIDHSDTDPARISVSIGRTDSLAVVSVIDDGPGIPDQELEALATGTEAALEGSTGTGLWLVHSIVDASDGEIVIRDNEPRGTIVELRFLIAGDH